MNNAIRNLAAEEKAAKTATPQKQRTPGRTDEVKNQAGGFTFKVNDKDRLERFLILGTDGGTYYVGERKLTQENIAFVRRMIQSDERLVVDTLVDVSVNARAFRNTPAIATLALVMVHGQDKAYARDAVNKVVRTGTHLFEFTEFLKNFGGLGRAKRKALAGWYTEKDTDSLAYQAVKYRQRNGWTHGDVFRLSHPVGVDTNVGNFILGKGLTDERGPEIIEGFRRMQGASSVEDVLSLLGAYTNLPWETIPTQFLTDPAVWKKLFYNNQLNGQALVRNITRLSRNGAFDDLQFAADYAARLVDVEMIRKTRLHPINFLNALNIHQNGQSKDNRNDPWGYYYMPVKDWNTYPVIIDALDEGFHASFKTVEPAGKRTMLGIDVSGSMAAKALGLDLTSAQISGAMAMTIARTEPAHIIRGFTTGGGYGRGHRGGAELTDLNISAKTSLNTAMKNVLRSNFGGTDCAQPMLWAKENKMEIDTFVVITDNETWAGTVKPFQALKQYRDATGIDARLAVLGTRATDFTIADPSDKGMMDFAGFDANAPRALAEFSAGRI